MAKAARRAVVKGGREALMALCSAACDVGRATGAGVFVWKGRDVSCLASVRLGALRFNALCPELAPKGRLRQLLRGGGRDDDAVATTEHRALPLRVGGHVTGMMYLEFPDHTGQIANQLRAIANIAEAVLEREANEVQHHGEQIAQHKELYRLRAQAEPQRKAKRRLAHDLKTPLVALKGYVDMMKRGMGGPLTEAQRRYLARMDQAVARQCALIDEALPVIETRCDVAATARKTLARLRKMDVYLEVAEKEPLCLEASHGEIALMIKELTLGALESAPAHSHLTLEVDAQGLKLRMEELPSVNARLKRCAALARRLGGKLRMQEDASLVVDFRPTRTEQVEELPAV
ncbi:MAG: histidine kinase dimerization/phospho-acceptor domain-containing protein [Myxococcaceae bacterium]